MTKAPARHILHAILLVTSAGLGLGVAHAELADRSKPMNVEADALRFDDAKQTSQFTGNVVVTQGTLVIRATRMDVRQDAQGHQFGTAYGDKGHRAFFRQKRDNLDEYIEGEANTLEYDGKIGQMRLIGQAEMRRYIGSKLSDTTSGPRITYNTDTQVFTVDGAGSQTGSGQRVRATIAPRNTGATDAPASSSAASSPATESASPHTGATPALRESTRLKDPTP